jgi:anti-sigma factor RsiW
MNTSEKPPTEGELLAMAYADGELAPDAARAFEERARREPTLAREVADLRRLQVLAREAAGPEPMDSEWERIAASGAHRASLGLGFALLLVGVIGVGSWATFELWRADLLLGAKIAISAFLTGFLLLLAQAIRARMRTLPYDSYTKVKR